MEFNIIEVTEAGLRTLNVKQMKLLRAAQRKKDELKRKMDREYEEYKKFLMRAGLHDTSLIDSKYAALMAEFEYQCGIIADDLLYDINANGSSGFGSDYTAGYLVDYTLSYNDRYKIVRDYYLAITDREERMRLYSADEVAKRYLGTYYETLYNVLATIDR